MERNQERIIIVATRPEYRLAPYYVSPKFDDATKTYLTGQEHLTPEQLKKQPLIISSEESYQIKHNMVLNLAVPHDKIFYDFLMLKDDVVAPSKKQVNPGQHRFYIENKEEEAIESINSIDLEYDALTLLRSLTLEEMNDFARLLGEPIKSMSKTQVESALKKRAKSNPKIILDVLQDKNKEYKIVLNKLIDADILTKKDGGKYYNGADLIGINELYAVEFLKDKSNSTMLSQWMQMIAPPEEPKTAKTTKGKKQEQLA